MQDFHATTICAVKKDGVTVVAGDGQVTMGNSVVFKGNAVKVKRIFGGKVVIGFAGTVSDAFTMSERFERMLQKFSGNLMRAAVALAEMWRNDQVRKLDAMMIAANHETLLIISGTGEIIDPDSGVCAIGSGGNYALAAARALYDIEGLSAEDIARKAMKIAGELCVYTNGNLTVEEV
ncbi:MAG: ATP-dependent protease subunit HslV [Clostridia bacterium]|nr:ATP-dependent protease subunit HslV [Clostridia bacterium]